MDKKYQAVSIWISLFVIALFFVTAVSEGFRDIGIPLSFLGGSALYAIEAMRQWKLGRRIFSFLQIVLAVLMLSALLYYFLRQKGIF